MAKVRDSNFITHKKDNRLYKRLYTFRCFPRIFLVTSCYRKEDQDQQDEPQENTKNIFCNREIQRTLIHSMVFVIIDNIRPVAICLISGIINLTVILHKLLIFFLNDLNTFFIPFEFAGAKSHQSVVCI